MSPIPWFKVDDTLAFHAKAVAAGNAAMGLWLRAGAWSAQQLTEGFIPDHMVTAMNGTKSAPTLVQVRLWDRVDGGYAFRGWGDYQPTRASVEAEREAARLRQQKARHKARQSKEHPPSHRDTDTASHNGHAVTHAVTQGVVTVPPTRPDPTHYSATRAEAAPTAQTLVAEWIDGLSNRPPGNVVGQVAKHVGNMLTEGISAQDLRNGITAWQRKGLNPSSLPSVVHEIRTKPSSDPNEWARGL